MKIIAIVLLITSVAGAEETQYTKVVSGMLASPKAMPYYSAGQPDVMVFQCNESDVTNQYRYTYLFEGRPIQTMTRNLKLWDIRDDKTNNLVLRPQSTNATALDIIVLCYNDITWQIGSLFYIFDGSSSKLNTDESRTQYKSLLCDVSGSRDCTWYLNGSHILSRYKGSVFIPGLHNPRSNGSYRCKCSILIGDESKQSTMIRVYDVKFVESINKNNRSIVMDVTSVVDTTSSRCPPPLIVNTGAMSGVTTPTEDKQMDCSHTLAILLSILLTALVTGVISFFVVPTLRKKWIRRQGDPNTQDRMLGDNS